ncbi:uncharacterized protein LOC132045609, partial [Lycium ferocissimum]|uniref:uncharacterized protein LOC132045609 n=1 Tax=Lycium ferocissimum TaxID=112874 RepID=UPI002815E309
MQVSTRGLSGANYHSSGQHGGYTTSSASVQRPTLDRSCYECGELGHIKRFCPRLRQGGQGTQYQAPRAPFAPDRGGKDRVQAGRGGHTAGRVALGPNRGSRLGRGRQQLGRGGAQTGQGNRNGSQATGGRGHLYTFPGRPEAEASDAVITGYHQLKIQAEDVPKTTFKT